MFQPWNRYRENNSFVQSQTRNSKQLHYNDTFILQNINNAMDLQLPTFKLYDILLKQW